MLGVGWIDIIRRIPVKLHNQVSFATTNGSEIMAQDILSLENDYLLMRGRMGGSQDAGRIIVLPYDRIVNLVVNKVLQDAEVEEIFGVAPLSAKRCSDDDFHEDSEGHSDMPLEEHDLAEDPLRETAVKLNTGAGMGSSKQARAQSENPSAPRPAEVSKSVLLARLRQRLAEQNKQAP